MPITRRSFSAGALTGLAAIALPGLSGCQVVQDILDARTAESLPQDWDVIVIGAGGAGMCAAISAFDVGAQVLVLEKKAQTGGNTAFTESGMNAAGTNVQYDAGVQDNPEAFSSDTLRGGHYKGDVALVNYMCMQSSEAHTWLDGLGVKLDTLAHSAGMEVARAHRPSDGSAIGSTLVPVLEEALVQREIPILFGAQVKRLLVDADGACKGVVVLESGNVDARGAGAGEEGAGAGSAGAGGTSAGGTGNANTSGKEITYRARSVVLATGGMCSNLAMVKQYRPDLEGCISTNQPASTGDGFVLAEEAGAQLIQMDCIQVHPTVAVQPTSDGHTPLLIPDNVCTAGGILVNANAERFFDETADHPYLAEAILNQVGASAWLIFDAAVRAENPFIEVMCEPRDIVVRANTFTNLASQMNINAEALEQNMQMYRSSIEEGARDAFGRQQGRRVFEGELFAIKVAVGAHYQMGGVRVNTESRVMDGSGAAIAGLFAAGEVTGGIHGRNRLGGNGVCDAVVFGRNAGLEAAGYASVLKAAGERAGANTGALAGIGNEAAGLDVQEETEEA